MLFVFRKPLTDRCWLWLSPTLRLWWLTLRTLKGKIKRARECSWFWGLDTTTCYTWSYNISREISEIYWFIASLFPRNSGITAKIDVTAAVSAKAVIYKLLSMNCFMLFALNGLYWFHKKTVDHFFHWRKKIVRNVDACVCFFQLLKRKVSCALPNISRLPL